MTDSKRWRDDPNAPAELRALMAAGVRPRGMTADERAQARAQLASMAAVGGAGWLASRSMLRGMGAGKTFVLAAVVGVATAAGLFVARHADPRGVAMHAVSVSHAAHAINVHAAALVVSMRTLPSPPPRVPLGRLLDADAVTPIAVVGPAPDMTRGIRHAAHAARTEPGEDPLTRESTLLQGAMRALANDPAVALRLADEHAREFPAGQLAAERAYVRVRALARLGRADDARAEARVLIEAHPSSMYAARVARLMEGSGDLR